MLALGVLFWIYGSVYFLIAAGLIGFIGVFIPYVADKIHWAWMKLAQAIGFVMSKVLLTIVYVLVLLPLSFLSRAFGSKNGVILKRGAKSYYTDRNYTYTKDSMDNVW